MSDYVFPDFTNRVVKKLNVHCPCLNRTETVLFDVSRAPHPFYYSFCGCDHHSGCLECRRCQERAEEWFRSTYPSLAPFLLTP